MVDKNWKDKLRDGMSEFETTPPEGLWEALEAAGAVGAGGKAGAEGATAGAAAGAAGAGLLARLFGRPLAPGWLSLAGVAAALAAFFLLRTPVPDQIGDPLAPATPSLTAETTPVIPDPIGDPLAPAELPDADAGTQNDTDLSTDPSETAASSTNTPAFVHGRSVTAPSSPTQIGDPTATTAPSLTAENTPSLTAETSPVIPDQIGDPLAPESPEPNPQTQDNDTPAAPAGNEPQEPSQNPAPTAPGVSQPAPGRTVVPLSRSVKRTRPLLAASLVGGGMPGSSATGTETVYGIPSGRKMASSGNRAMALVSRNRPTEVTTMQRIDYQFGLLATYNFSEHFGVESGLQYTRLGSTKTSASGTLTTVTEENLDYIGLPLRLVYTPLNVSRFSAYISAGPELEYGISHIWRSYDNLNKKTDDATSGRDVPGDFVFSASLNAGIQVSPWSSGAFFIQPGVVYRWVDQGSPESYYTTHPWSFRLSAGYRIMF